jgi:hypothetical protein
MLMSSRGPRVNEPRWSARDDRSTRAPRSRSRAVGTTRGVLGVEVASRQPARVGSGAATEARPETTSEGWFAHHPKRPRFGPATREA